MRRLGRNNVLGERHIPAEKEYVRDKAGYVHSDWNGYGQKYHRRTR